MTYFLIAMKPSKVLINSVKKAFYSLIASLTLSSAFAQEPEPTPTPPKPEIDPLEKFNWETSGRGEIGSYATIDIPGGYRFLNGLETAKVMSLFGNLPSTYEGMIGPDDLSWFVIFQYEDSGYVEDDEKDDLDADELLETLREQEEASNEERRERGLDTLTTSGWAVEPNYNESTNNLEWGVIFELFDGGSNVNFLTKLLGRHGIMHTTLVCDTEALQGTLPAYQELLTGYEYNTGKTYAEFEEGDKVSEYGLKALVAGGAIFAAAKLGLFAKLLLFFKKGFKLIAIGAIAIGIWIKRIITGKRVDA